MSRRNVFTADGKPSPSVSQLMDFLRRIESSRMATELVTASLAEAGVIERWPLQVPVSEKKAGINDLYRVNGSALGGLDDEAFLKLRKTGALRLGLCADHVHATDRPLRSAGAAAVAARAATQDPAAGGAVQNGADRSDPVRLKLWHAVASSRELVNAMKELQRKQQEQVATPAGRA